ncbi:MAG: cytochrome c [Sphingobacteriales bacterium]|nr:cytochrome c [Sphingobacteriales bacterium]
MKKNTIITVLTLAITGIAVITGCDSKREPGKTYMPDMAYSRAVETNALLDSTVFTDNAARLGQEIFYNRKPVPGTIRRGELFPYTLPNDSIGYKLSAQVKNPLPALSAKDSAEASRLFNINCAICHGADGKASGPLAGKIGGIANLATINITEGTMFHSVTYGKGLMGSYASQLDRKQRWMIIHYIETLRPKATAVSVATEAKADSTSTTKK